MFVKRNNSGWQRVLGLIIPYYATLSLFVFLGFLFAGIDIVNKKSPETTNQHLILSFFSLLGTFLIIWIFTKYIDKEKFINLGFSKNIKQFIIGILLASGILIFGFCILLYLNEIKIVDIDFNTNEIIKVFFIFIFIALNEEILFRGYILKNLMISFDKYIALTISALLFALIHGANPSMSLLSIVDLFFAGIFLGSYYIYTKNLWFAIGLHFSWNLSQTLIGFNVSGLDTYSIITFKINQNNILNGGDFGFEGSIFSIIIQVIIITIIIIYYQSKKRRTYI